jgi:hypothetical protein
MLRGLERERMEWISVLAAILSAGVAHATGDRPGAITALNLAIERAEAASMSMYAASARYQLGSILGGEKGTGLVTQALEAMRVQEVRAPARFAAMLVPITQFSPHEAHDHRTNWQLH